MKKILIIQTAFLGDVILATSLVQKIKSKDPEAVVDFLLRKGNESVLKGNPDIETLYILDKKKKVSSMMSIVSQVRKKKYDLVLNLHRFGSSGIIAFLSGAEKVYGFDKNPFAFSYTKKVKHEIGKLSRVHEVDRNAELVKDLYGVERVRPKLYISDEIFNRVRKFKSEKYVCMAPGSVWFTKRFPKSKWIELIERMPSDCKIYLLGAPDEEKLCAEVQAGAKRSEVVNLAGKLSILESAGLMKDAGMNFVNDSAPMHLASAVNAPVCAIYCSTVPAFGFGPLSENSNVVEIKEELPCRPCNLHGKKECPMGHFNCAHKINVADIVEVYHRSIKEKV